MYSAYIPLGQKKNTNEAYLLNLYYNKDSFKAPRYKTVKADFQMGDLESWPARIAFPLAP